VNPTSYQQAAMRTNSDTVGTYGRDSINLAHAALGLCDEVAELRQALERRPFNPTNFAEECGDLLWFVALGFEGLHVDFWGTTDYYVGRSGGHTATQLRDLESRAMAFAATVKGAFAYGRDVNDSRATIQLAEIAELVADMLSDFGLTTELAMQANINKLQARYPEKFSADRANRRDLAAEEAALELEPGAIVCTTPDHADMAISRMCAYDQQPQRRFDSKLRQWVVWPTANIDADRQQEKGQ
jgi:hypothetical protein